MERVPPSLPPLSLPIFFSLAHGSLPPPLCLWLHRTKYFISTESRENPIEIITALTDKGNLRFGGFAA